MSWFLLADAFAKIEGLDGYLEMTWKETIVIELGAGCGLSGFVAAHHRFSSYYLKRYSKYSIFYTLLQP